MSEPITWGSYFAWKLICVALGLALSGAFAIILAMSDASYCRKCGRGMQWRWRRPRIYAKRRWCAFCDQEAGE